MTAELVEQVTVPAGWDCVNLGRLVDEERAISYGIVQPGAHEPGGVPIVRVNNLRAGRILTDEVLKVGQAIEANYARTRLCGGEVLLSLVGTIGECAVVPAELAGWNVARAVAVIPVRKGIDPRWVAMCLRSVEVQGLIRAWATTTVQATLNLRDVRQLPILLPSDRERERITQVVTALDDKIEQNRRTARALERLARAIFRAWFVDFEPVQAKAAGAASFPSMPQTAFDALPTRLVDSAIGPVPEGWEVKALPEAIAVNPKRQLRKGQVAPYLDMKNMPTNGHAPDAWIERAVGSGMRFENGDTLVARITPCLENGKTAFVDFLDDGEIGWGSTEYIVLRPKPPLPDVYAYCLARTDEFRDFAIQNMTGTSGRQRVAASTLDHYQLAVPDAPIADAFGEVVAPLFDAVRAGMDDSRKLAELRDLLLPKLLSGAVRAGDLPQCASNAQLGDSICRA